ncbi:MAG: hypothetical protein HW400_663 [Candidatus Levybacteria bacterium]|nr:hypothetical protein [Candidatus Levybacteria bacterium]
MKYHNAMGESSKDQAPRALAKEIQIGGGDIINIASFKEIVDRPISYTSGAYYKDLPAEALDEAQGEISKLPFRFGSTEYIGTGTRPLHKADVIIGQRMLAYDAPESEQAKKSLIFRFNEDTRGAILSLNTHNGLSVENGRDTGDTKQATIIRFTPESALKVAGKEIGEVTLVIPPAPLQGK